MGTNYYLIQKNTDRDESCEVSKMLDPSHTLMHIGKSSGGWCFSLHVYPERQIHNWDNWKSFLQTEYLESEAEFVLVDEYYQSISLSYLFTVIEDRSNSTTWEEHEQYVTDPQSLFGRYNSLQAYLDKNGAIKGPNNLMRHKIDGNHCIGHGEGPYDYIIGEFC